MQVVRNRRIYTLYIYYALCFIATGMTTYAPKYYGEIGLFDSQIGIISAVAALLALAAQPAWGILADRARYKRSVLAIGLLISGLMCFLVPTASTRFIRLLAVLTLYSIFQLPAMPVANAISIEYTQATGHRFGPVRMMGTIGYQAGILATGFFLTQSLYGLYPAMGAMLLLTAASALLLPPVRGHQRDRDRISCAPLFKNRSLLLLFAFAFIGHIGHQFNLVFFSKHLGDLGIDNTVTGIINTLSVVLEIPFLIFGDRIMKHKSIWSWLLVGMIVGAIRFILLSVLNTPVWIVMVQMLSIAHFSCFEFFPFIYLGKVAGKELQASAQSMYQMITFGFARIVASLLGGAIADITGISAVYLFSGLLMAVAVPAFFFPMRKRAQSERE